MIKRKLRAAVLFLLFLNVVSGQERNDSLVAHFNLMFGRAPLELHKNYITQNNDTLQVDLFKFYITNIEVHYRDSTFVQRPSAHLIDIENLNSTWIPLCINTKKAIESVSFNIGVDSLSSVSGALADNLDPTKGMYWAWQSGFINMKIEGTSKSCKTRKNEFQFHIGGYLKPNYAMRRIELKTPNQNLDIDVDVSQLFDSIQLSKLNSVMIPGKDAMGIADRSVLMFSSR